MGKQGPCCHCGVTTTPLWRNGPPEKPVLCNACGSRWRTKGSLVNYTPLHARPEMEEYECKGGSSGRRSIHVGGSKEVKLLKRKQIQESASVATASAVRISILDTTIMTGLQKAVDDDTSNRSSSGSAISISESCTHFGGYTDASDLTGSSQPVIWEATIPSRKRTCVGRPRESSVEKLTKDLCSILHEQSSYFSASSEEDLLLECGTPMLSIETGHGSVLMRHPTSSIGREEESEASSLSFTTPPIRIGNGIPMVDRRDHNITKREKERFQVLRSRNSPLCCVDIQDVVNFLEFEEQLTVDEQLQLLKYLPSVDTESIRDMFSSREFMEDLMEFQKLLSVGIFEHSKSWSGGEDCRELRRLILTERTKSKWVECYSLLKRREDEGMVFRGRDSVNFRFSPCPPLALHQFSGSVVTVKNERRVSEAGSPYGMEGAENEGGWFSPKSLFCVPPGGGELMVDAMRGVVEDDGCDHDMLLGLPSHTSFPEAELLRPPSAPTSFSPLVRLPLS